LTAKGAIAVSTGFDRDSMLQQEQNFIAELGLRLRIRNRDARTARPEEKRRSYARLAKSDHQHALVSEIHSVIAISTS
jgi:hypothetical protein